MMKKSIFTLLFAVISLASRGQSILEHLTFKGVPIDGTLSEYVAKMKSAGFSHVATEDGNALLSGEFAGYRNCTIGVLTSKKKNLVYEIAVLFPTKDTWRGLNYDYSKLKSMLSEKYGEPQESVEEFYDIFGKVTVNLNDDAKIAWAQSNQYKYQSFFCVENGTILLSIEHDKRNFRVKLWYSDKLNSEVANDAAIDDL